ncbi:MAG: rubredoxin [Bacilli bacterium]
MKKFRCTICSYIYDEEKGIVEKGIAPGTKWSDLPNDWQCPLCGAPKSMFVEVIETTIISQEKEEIKTDENLNIVDNSDVLREVSYKELSTICSNLAKGCEKQYLEEESKLFNELVNYFNKKEILDNNSNYDDLITKINNNLEKEYPTIKNICNKNKDRGTLRAITWGEKTTLILKSLIERYQNEGSKFLENTGVYVCDICGFIYIGNDVVSICPICKVPSLKILQIKGGK